jgi:hypothetical protein
MSQRPTRHVFFPEANNEVRAVLSECDSRKALNSGPGTRSHYLLVINICPVINAAACGPLSDFSHVLDWLSVWGEQTSYRHAKALWMIHSIFE